MASSVRTIQIHTVSSSQVKIPNLHFVSSLKHHISSNASAGFGTPQFLVFSHRQTTLPKFVLLRPTFCSLSNDGGGNDEIDGVKAPAAAATIHTAKHGARFDLKAVGRFKETVVASFPRVSSLMKINDGINPAIGLCIGMALLFVSIRLYVVRKSRYRSPGSVADLVRRGQLRSDRRGISLKYEDPFNNPLVKVAKSNSSVEMCGKTYRLAPVTLTKEQQAIHQKRRSRAYQWKRPTMFLKEGDTIPPDVDPDTIRWIPANHPFATTATDIDEDMAQNNVYQKHGVPFRIQAEHEALQRKLEVLQSEEKLNKMVIDPANAKDFERPFTTNSRSYDAVEQNPTNNQVENLNKRKSDHPPNSFGNS